MSSTLMLIVGIFHHSEKSRAVWLNPLSPDNSIHRLQVALEGEFMECNSDKRPYQPHLSIGQAKNDEEVNTLSEHIHKCIVEHLFEHSYVSSEQPALSWNVDRVYVIERKGYNDRFKIIGTIDLGKTTEA
jgi:2'-5' RNA ligase